MPGPTTERLDDDFRLLRDDMQDIKVILARMDTKLAELETLKADGKSNALSLAVVEARLAWLIGGGKWLGSIFALAAVYGAFSIWGRLGVVETQLRGVDGRLGVVETQLKGVDGRLGAVETQLRGVDGRLGVVETQLRGVDGRLGAVETQLRGVDGRLGAVETQIRHVGDQVTEIKGAISRRQVDTSAELEERINRIARAVVDEAIKRTMLPKPSP